MVFVEGKQHPILMRMFQYSLITILLTGASNHPNKQRYILDNPMGCDPLVKLSFFLCLFADYFSKDVQMRLLAPGDALDTKRSVPYEPQVVNWRTALPGR